MLLLLTAFCVVSSPRITPRAFAVQYGGGEISIAFDSSVPDVQRPYILGLFNDVYPKLKYYFGAPGATFVVTVAYDPSIRGSVGCGGEYGGKRISMAAMPFECSSHAANDAIFDEVFTHELAHAFQLEAIHPSTWTGRGEPGLWSIEGMATVAQWLIAVDLERNGIRHFDLSQVAHSLKLHDSFNYLGLDTIGGWFDYKNKGSFLWPELYYYAAAMLYIMTAALGQYNGDMTFLARLNNAMYSEATLACNSGQPHCDIFDDYRILSVIRSITSGGVVDGLPADQWLSLQAITFQPGNLGPRLGVYFQDPSDLRTIRVFAFERVMSGGTVSERPIPNLQVDLFWQHSGGTPEFTVVTNADGVASNDLPISYFTDRGNLPFGGYVVYVVYARAEYAGVSLVSRNYGFSMGTFGPPPMLLEETRMFGVLFDGIGIPDVFPLTVSGTGGTSLVLSTNGAFVTETPTSEVPSQIRVTSTYNGVEYPTTYSKPNPFTRVVWKLGGPHYDFQLVVTPNHQQVTAGTSTQFEIVLTGQGPAGEYHIDSYPISLAARGTTYWIASINPYLATSFENKYILTVTTLSEAPPGSYSLTVLASSGPLFHTQVVTLEIIQSQSTTTSSRVSTSLDIVYIYRTIIDKQLGETTIVTVQLQPQVSGKLIRLELSIDQSKWVTIAANYTDLEGRSTMVWSPASVPTGIYYVRAVWDGDSGYTATTSQISTMTVIPEFRNVALPFIVSVIAVLVALRQRQKKTKRHTLSCEAL